MILDRFALGAKKRVALAKETLSLPEIKKKALSLPKGNPRFEKALRAAHFAFICEVKRASPSKGILDGEFDYIKIAREYESAGASAISVLTEPEYFLGSNAILSEIRAAVKTPVLRKDFVVDEYQLYESRVMGADAVLLICALLDADTIRRYLVLCGELGLSALVEAHDAKEVDMALHAGASIIGVNNRDLNTFEVDINTCVRLRDMVPEGVLYVAESGVGKASDIALLHDAGVDAVLIGEALMKSADKKAALDTLRKGIKA